MTQIPYEVTIVYCVVDDRVLLGMKKRDFGEGKWNGYGGKIERGETSAAAAVRELQEESGLIADENDLVRAAFMRFYFNNVLWENCRIFILKKWQGELVETDEMKPRWFDIQQLPFDEMWAADRVWLPLVLSGKKIEADAYFDEGGNIMEKIEHKEVPVLEFF
jgi:8-oxo-dGTP pyrophosphatase MutT (NUDIX family)